MTIIEMIEGGAISLVGMAVAYLWTKGLETESRISKLEAKMECKCKCSCK